MIGQLAADGFTPATTEIALISWSNGYQHAVATLRDMTNASYSEDDPRWTALMRMAECLEAGNPR